MTALTTDPVTTDPVTTDPVAADAPAVESPADAERPVWLPSQFQTPDMLAKSWKEATRKITSQGTQLSEMATENEQLTAEIERLLAGREEFAVRLAAMERAFIATLAGTQ